MYTVYTSDRVRRMPPRPRPPRPAPDGAPKGSDRPKAVTTRLFRSGNSTAVRLPKPFADALGPDDRVTLRRLSGGRVLVEPVRKRAWRPGFFDEVGRVSPDFADAVAAGRADVSSTAEVAREEARAAGAFEPAPREPAPRGDA